MIILGLNCFHGDASAALFRDGELIAAVEEERFNRFKHSGGFPTNAVRWCVSKAKIDPREIDYVAIPRKSNAHILRKLIWAARLPVSSAGRIKALKNFTSLKEQLAACFGLRTNDIRADFKFVEHHLAHMSSSFYTSPYKKSAVVSIDGMGDHASMVWGIGEDNKLAVKDYVYFPHSLGYLYTAITQYLGMEAYGDEYKTMGLASYGNPKYTDVFEQIVRLGNSIDFKLDLNYFTHHKKGIDMTFETGEPYIGKMFSDKLVETFGPPRASGSEVTSHHKDIASSLQKRIETVVLELLRRVKCSSRQENICYAGGVAFNCVLNGRILGETGFDNLYIQPAAGDAGLSIGASLFVYHNILGNPRKFVMNHSYWGPEYSNDQINDVLKVSGSKYFTKDENHMFDYISSNLADGKIVAWYQGKAEWGPRALGNRSILADPRNQDMKEILNEKIKNRETFRPFAPSVLREKASEWFEDTTDSPFMLITYRARKNKIKHMPAPIHVDGSARIQTVDETTNPLYWNLIKHFENKTGVPALINTSFNESEPIVDTPKQALETFKRTNMDILVMGNYVIE